MRVERWDPAVHASLLAAWVGLASTDELDLSYLPPTGVVVDRMVAGFLYLTDSCVAYFDNFISDPSSTGESRSAAMDVMVSELLLAAKAAGAKVVVFCTARPGLVARTARMGFQPESGYTFMKKEL